MTHPSNPTTPGRIDHDVILVGGGLANCLIALRLMAVRPEVDFLIVERGEKLGGNHTWSFHTGDVTPETLASLGPFIEASWPRQSVRFPGLARTIEAGYHSMSSEKLRAGLAPRLGRRLLLGASTVALASDSVTLADGRVFTARCVIDGRGLDPGLPLALGYQKFYGAEVETEQPHGEHHPVIMDATVPQIDGYRFVYTLPFGPRSILIEDTYYSDGPEVDTARLRERVTAHAAAKGWTISRLVREETGVLPIVLAGDIDALCRAGTPGVPRVGLRAALFHPTTGYSLPDAAAVAELIARAPVLKSAPVARLIETHVRHLWSERAFFRLLNRMLFIAAEPDQRADVFERFYRLPAPLIERFYSARLTFADQVRILLGKPPVAIPKALGALRSGPAWTLARRAEGGRR